MALRTRKVSGAFEKQPPGLELRPLDPESNALNVRPLYLHCARHHVIPIPDYYYID